MVFEENDGGVDNDKEFLRVKKWDVYMNKNKELNKGGCYVEEGKENYDIVLQGFDFNLFDEDEEGVVREGLCEYPYSLILMKLQPRGWKNELKRMNMKVDEDNGKAVGMVD